MMITISISYQLILKCLQVYQQQRYFPEQLSPNSQQLIIVKFHATVFSSNPIKAAIAPGFKVSLFFERRRVRCILPTPDLDEPRMPLFERSLPGRKLALVEGQVADATELPDLPCVESGVRAAHDEPSGAVEREETG